MRILLFLCLILFSQYTWTQTQVLPFLKGDKYAIIDQNGKEIVPGVFDDLVIYNDHKLLALLKNDLWGIYSFEGKKLLDHTIGKKSVYQIGPSIKKAFNRIIDEPNIKLGSPNGLLTVSDTYAKISYYINPNKLLDNYKAYSLKATSDRNEGLFKRGMDNIEKVMYTGQRFNFIDSTGYEIFETPVGNGYALNNILITLSENKKYALFNLDKKLTDYKYTRISTRIGSSLIFGSYKIKGPNGYDITVYDIWSSDGKILRFQLKNYKVSGDYVIVNKEDGFELLESEGKEMISDDKQNASFIKLGSKLFLSTQNNNNYGLRDLKGNYVLDTTYTFIRVEAGMLSTRTKDYAAVLDTNLKEVIRLDSVASLSKDENSDHFKVGYNKSWYTVNGLVDLNKNMVVPAEWRAVWIQDCNNLVYLKSDSTIHIRKLGSDDDILKTSTDYNVTVDCKNQNLVTYKSGEKTLYDLEGNFIIKYGPKMMNGFQNQSNFIATKKGSDMILTNQQGLQVIDKTYKKITVITDPKDGKSIYICQIANGKIPNSDVYDDELKTFIPEGYTFPERWSYKMKINPGSLLVTNSDATQFKFKTGMIDYEGNWLFKPINGMFQHIEENLFMMADFDKESLVFYNSKGKIISENEYDIIDKGSGSDFFEDRILVGTVVDKEYKKKIKRIYEQNQDYRKAREQLYALGTPAIKYRYLNLNGERINNESYDTARAYGMSQNKTTVGKKINGKTISQVIDPDGKVYFEKEVDELDFLADDYYQGKVEGKWAIMDTLGDIKTPFKFTSISRFRRSNHFQARTDNEYFYITDEYKMIPLGNHDQVKINSLNDSYFFIETSNKIADSYKYKKNKVVFDTDGNIVVELGNVSGIRTQFNNVALPENYIAIQPERESKHVIYDLKNKRYLRD